MESTTTALWERLPQARITLAKALDLYEAANRARNLSPRSADQRHGAAQAAPAG